MSRVFVDDSLMSWEAYSSGGKYGLPDHPKIVFHCLSDPQVRPRFVVHQGDEADVEETVHEIPEERLKEMLRESRELE